MAPESTVVILGRSPEKMSAASAVLEAHGFAVLGVFTEADALRAIAAAHDSLLAVVAGGSVSAAARERLTAAAHGAVIVDAAIGHADPVVHFRSEVLPQLIAARTGRAAAH
jgi:hypothetical protein